MPERVVPGPVQGNPAVREAVCIHTNRIYDSCRDKECLEDLRVYLTQGEQNLLDNAVNVKVKAAEIIWVYIDVEAVPFNRGFYTIDIKYFYKVFIDVFTGVCKPHEITGLATYDKRIILFGSEGSTKTFCSNFRPSSPDIQGWYKTNMPIACVEVVDPIVLGSKVVEPDEKCCCCNVDITSVPEAVCRCFNDRLTCGDDDRKLFVTLGQFTIVRLERDSQLLIPTYDFCVPTKECVGGSDITPCELFDKIKFPTQEFFPPDFDGHGRDHDDCDK